MPAIRNLEPYRAVFNVRGLLMVPPMLFCALVFVGEYENDAVVFGVGGAVFAVGLAIRVWSQIHLHYRLRVRKVLTTSGPYAFVRNPIYIGNTIILLGLTVMSELLWFIPVTLIWAGVVYAFVVRYEEAHLLNKYGAAYATYLDRVPRWIPVVPVDGYVAQTGVVRQFFCRSVRAELHCFLLILPFLVKEVIDHAFDT